MRAQALALALMILGHGASAEPAGDAITRLKSCFQLDRAARAGCLEKLSKELPDGDSVGSLPPAADNWIVSETTSPVDYSPIVTAATQSAPVTKDAPTTLAIRCRGQRTELMVNTEGYWRASPANQLQVDASINEQPAIRTRWTASADGKTAVFRDDAVRFLQSWPDDGRITIAVLNPPGAAQQATFRLSGLEKIRQKIGAACKWAPAAGQPAPPARQVR
jgi:Type VI secretion system VasI, EvfG, VC_A0118